MVSVIRMVCLSSLFLVVGCAQSLQSIIPPSEVLQDDQLIGTWTNESAIFRIEKLTDRRIARNGYLLTAENEEKSQEYLLQVTKVADTSYFQVTNSTPQGLTVLSTYVFGRYEIENDTLTFDFPELTRFQELIRKENLPHVMRDGVIVLTSTPEDTAAFLKKHNDELFFRNPYEYKPFHEKESVSGIRFTRIVKAESSEKNE